MTVILDRRRRPKAQALAAGAATAAPKDGPLTELDLRGMLAVRSFMVASVEDLQRQVAHHSVDPRVTRRQLLQIKGGAELIAAWATDVVGTIDQMLEKAGGRPDPTEPAAAGA